MAQVQQGNTVKVHYTGKLSNGDVFDSSRGREPLEFKVGDKKLIAQFEEAVVGMNPGETRTISISADDAYGQHRDDLVGEIPADRIPQEINPQVGQILQFTQPDGQIIPVTVTKTDEKSITIDANHPLAGQDLTFEIELVEITA